MPKTVKVLRRFLGMLNFYRRFVPRAAELRAPLHSLLQGPKVRGSQKVYMATELTKAFQQCKQSLTEAVRLAHSDPSANLRITTDASDVAIGAVLQQEKNGCLEPLAVFSHKLSPVQFKYSPYDRELLAI